MSPESALRLLFSVGVLHGHLTALVAIVVGTAGAVACLFFASEYVSETRKALAKRRVRHLFKGDINDESRSPIVLSPGIRWPPPNDLQADIRWTSPSASQDESFEESKHAEAKDTSASAPLSVLYPQELQALTGNPWAAPQVNMPEGNITGTPHIVITDGSTLRVSLSADGRRPLSEQEGWSAVHAPAEANSDTPNTAPSSPVLRERHTPTLDLAASLTSEFHFPTDPTGTPDEQQSLSTSEIVLVPTAPASPVLRGYNLESNSSAEDFDLTASLASQFRFPQNIGERFLNTATSMLSSQGSTNRSLSELSGVISSAASSFSYSDAGSSRISDAGTDQLSPADTHDFDTTTITIGHPWNNLPELVLVRIFVLGPAKEGWTYVVGASHVCRSWRAAALRECSLWTVIPFRSTHASSAFLARTHAADATLRSPLTRSVDSYFASLRPYLSRLRALTLELAEPDMRAFCDMWRSWGTDPGAVPQLTTLELLLKHQCALAVPVDVLRGQDTLGTLQLHNFTFAYLPAPLPALHKLTYSADASTDDSAPPVSSDLFLTFLCRFPALEELHVHHIAFDMPSGAISGRYPCLRRVHAIGSPANALVSQLAFHKPDLALHVWCEAGPADDMASLGCVLACGLVLSAVEVSVGADADADGAVLCKLLGSNDAAQKLDMCVQRAIANDEEFEERILTSMLCAYAGGARTLELRGVDLGKLRWLLAERLQRMDTLEELTLDGCTSLAVLEEALQAHVAQGRLAGLRTVSVRNRVGAEGGQERRAIRRMAKRWPDAATQGQDL
ncbi:hypothetical protein DENSPDRAFT_843908 [Dentipellis sp. KUC8613]|nr:hypothetical protein DENSPDRAFT_843908 [Dentipellis sp. KUC8613]